MGIPARANVLHEDEIYCINPDCTRLLFFPEIPIAPQIIEFCGAYFFDRI